MKGVLGWFTFRRLFLAVLPTAALTAGGVVAFGGDDEREPARSQRPATIAPADPPGAASDEDVLGVAAEPDGAPEPANPKPKAKRKRDRADDPDDVSADPAPPEPDPAADTGAAVRQAVTDMLATSGYAGAEVDVSDGGRAVRVSVSRGQACDPDAATGERLAQRIRSGLPEVRSVRVTVRGSDRTLTDYRRTRCDREREREETPSEGAGRVVYAKRGSGSFTTPTFAIAARTWTVTFRNDSDFFQAFVVKDGRIQPFVLNSDRRGTRTETLRGPGRFRLKINGAAGWSVSVRDGA